MTVKELNIPERKILINNLLNVQNFLELDVREYQEIVSPNLEKNKHILKVNTLLEKIPYSFHTKALQDFYEQTGLKIQVEIHHSNYTLKLYDRNGQYPIEDAFIWNREFVSEVAHHPEWLEPQEIPDIIVQWIFPLEEQVPSTITNHYFIF